MRLLSLLALMACRPAITEPAHAIAPAVPVPFMAPVPVPVPLPVPAVAAAQPLVFAHTALLDDVAAAGARSAAADYVVSAHAIRASMIEKLGSGLWPYVLSARGSDAEIEKRLAVELAELRTEVSIAELGYAIADGPVGRVGVIVALPPPNLPVAVARGSDTARISLPWAWPDEPMVFAVTATASRRLAPVVDHAQLALAVDCRKPADIEIRAGERVVANIVGACGVAAVDPPVSAPEAINSFDVGPPARTRVEIEQRAFELVVRERVAHGLAPLVWDAEIHAFARAHSNDMAAHAYVGHEAPDGSNLEKRVARETFTWKTTRENVGHAWGPGEAHFAFMKSPGHRANLLAGDIDRGAIGVASDRAERDGFYITQFFRTP